MAEEKKEKVKEKAQGLDVSGFTLGVVGIVFAGWIGLVIGLIGFVFCMVHQRRHVTKTGKIGMILNVIAVVLSVAVIVLYTQVIEPLIGQIPAA